ncbi:MAG: tripartite tricarboxylate transporter substrate binding protein [Firmicutes bacterium]|nr:tripartite tricarboxylate transporter substrate binding protein [Bacillota bacterium]
MPPKRSALLILVLALVVGLVLPGCSSGKKFPAKQIDMIIPWPAGGASDLAARLIAKHAEKELGVAISPTNVAGSNGAMGWAQAAKAKNDGYTVCLATFDILTNQAMGTSPVKYDDFEYLMQFTAQPFGVMVHGDSQFKTLQDLVESAKSNPEKVKIGTTPLGGVFHQAVALLEKASGAKFSVVPFKGSPDLNAALLGKHIDAQMNTISLADQHIKSGTIRLLAVTTDSRMPDYPNAPTLKELGYDVVYESWRAIAVPKGISADVKKVLEDAFVKAYKNPEFLESAKKSKFDPFFRDAAEFKKFVDNLYPRVVQVVKDLNLTGKQ